MSQSASGEKVMGKRHTKAKWLEEAEEALNVYPRVMVMVDEIYDYILRSLKTDQSLRLFLRNEVKFYPNNEVRLKYFRMRYEEYCLSNQYDMAPIMGNPNAEILLKRDGYTMIHKQAEAFQKVRFREGSERKHTALQHGQSPWDLFVTCELVVSYLDSDCELREAIESKYKA